MPEQSIIVNDTQLIPASICFIETAPEHLLDSQLNVVRSALAANAPLIVVSAIRPAMTLLHNYSTNGIDIAKILVVDCVSEKPLENKIGEVSNTIYADAPGALTSIQICVDIQSHKAGKGAVLLLDSVSALILHNPPLSVARFLHAIFTRCRLSMDICCVLVAEGSLSKEVRAEVIQLCDVYLHL